jgi:NAD(P)-dependent dehydrogenase (short-subunit alcohol dehydrogenase family)
VVFGIRALAPVIARSEPRAAGSGSGGIVVTASLAGLIGYSPDPIYALTKHAVIGLVRALAPQLAELGNGVTVNAVCPSLVDTPLLDDGMREALAGSGFPLIEPETVADAVLDCLAGTATGQAMVIQAGLKPVAYRFGRPPGPRATGSEGAVPPVDLAAHDQQ